MSLLRDLLARFFRRLSHKHAGLALEHQAKAHHYEEKAANCLPEMEVDL